MLKEDILDLINKFEMETWKYNSNNKLDDDMEYIYLIENEVKKADETELKSIYYKLTALMGIIRFKYGFESLIINNIPEFKEIKTLIDNISLDDNNIIDQYNNILNIYNDSIKEIKNINFIKNKYMGIQGKEGLYLMIESLKSLITNNEYKKLLKDNQINEVIVDCIKLNNGIINTKTIELKYKEIIKKIWEQSLTSSLDEDGKFRMLFSNISGGNLKQQAELLMNRPVQSSCSMISSEFIATYGSDIRKIGFIYPNNSEIIMTSAYDLGSNVFGTGIVNSEKGTLLSTPEVIEKIGINRAKNKGEDLYSSNCYNEILVNSKPCGIVVIGLGEKDINIFYQDVSILAQEMNLPLYFIDTMQYKNELSDKDKEYLAFHSIMSYFNISSSDLSEQNNNYVDVYNLIDVYKEQIANIFLELKKCGKLNKNNMCEILNNVIDSSKKITR